MHTHEDSMPIRFTPDGLDEATIDALINETFAQVSDVPFDEPLSIPDRPIPDRRPVRRHAGKQSPNGRAA